MAGNRETAVKNIQKALEKRPARPNWQHGWCSYKKTREVPPASKYILKQAEHLKQGLLAREVDLAGEGEVNPVRAILIDSLVDVWTLRRLGVWHLLKSDISTQPDLLQRVLDAAKTEVRHGQALGVEMESRQQKETLQDVLAQIASEDPKNGANSSSDAEDGESPTNDAGEP